MLFKPPLPASEGHSTKGPYFWIHAKEGFRYWATLTVYNIDYLASNHNMLLVGAAHTETDYSLAGEWTTPAVPAPSASPK